MIKYKKKGKLTKKQRNKQNSKYTWNRIQGGAGVRCSGKSVEEDKI